MTVIKRSLAVLSILMVSSSPYSSSAAPDTIKKVLTLSVGFSELFQKDVPKLSVSNGHLAVDETSIGVALDKDAFSKLFTNKWIEQDDPIVYREARNFRNATALFNITYVDGTVDKKTFSLAPDAAAEGIIKPSKFLLALDAEVTVQFDVYRCLKENSTCVFEKSPFERLSDGRLNAVGVTHNRRMLLRCENRYLVEVEGNIDHPEIQYISFDRFTGQDYLHLTLGLKSALSAPVRNGAEFNGFETIVNPYYHEDPIKMKVTRANDELLVETRFLDGRLYRSASFGNCKNNP
ncbi:MAG: hypothetical protein NTV34_14150 [Proteobacteria bacterium]|nr:hypothetical protein [Pseudomonadota bacterium]